MAKRKRKGIWSLEYAELPGEIDAMAFPHGDYACDEPLDDDIYEKRLEKLQIELVKLQAWGRAAGERIVLVLEGRDAAGKGGVIQRFTQHINPRYAHVVALDKPSDVEAGQWYFQRYIAHLPHRGHIALFDRSWYNRAGVERVMGFCKDADVERFFDEAPVFEGMLKRTGLRLFKFWLDMSRAEQLKRFYERKNDPLKSWKLSPMDYEAVGKWDDYTRAIRDIIAKTDTKHAPWTVVDANDQRRARLECMKVVLSAFDYEGKEEKNIGKIDRRLVLSGRQSLVATSKRTRRGARVLGMGFQKT
jgi:polyphosphate kinase 2